MAKSSRRASAQASPAGSELIVIVQDDLGLRSAGTTVSSAAGKKVSGINTVLRSYEGSLTPIFGPENRVVNMSRFATAAFEKAGVSHPANYYKLDASGNLDEIAEALLNEGTVAAAYVKPPSEPPVIIEEKMAPPKPGDEAPPVTPNFVGRQLYLNAAPGGVDAQYAWTQAGGKGAGVRIIDIEGAWRFTHEDLRVNQGGVIAGTPSTDIGWRNHGTAVAGEFGGDENTFGVTGICPDANTRAISIFGTGMSSSVVIRRAADSLAAGDIILIELHRPGPRNGFAQRNDQLGYIAVEWWPDDYAAIIYATSRGILVVEAGGNGAENLSDGLYNTRPSGFPTSWFNPFNTANPTSNAVLVGAGAPPPGTHGANWGPDRSRLDFSNYGARVDVQGWGREVTTCGYGNLQGGPNEDFWYTDTFSGTSSASPIIVGVLGCLQGRQRDRSKPLLTPATARNLLRTTGSPQQDAPSRPATQRIGNRPDLRQAFSTLGIGTIKIKEIKEVKEIIKEKDLVKDTKEKDTKEIKDKEMKEKDLVKDTKEKELKEIIKEGKEFKEKDFKDVQEKVREVIGGGGGVIHTSAEGTTDVEGRLQNLENMIQQLSHFITGENRPDLYGALYNQGGYGQQDDLTKNSNDAKQSKDSKDMETI